MQQMMSQLEQSLGVTSALWDITSKSAGLVDAQQRLQQFQAGLNQLQSQFTTPFTMAGAAPPNPWQNMAGAFAMPGTAAPFGMPFAMPFADLPGLGPAREQQESLQRMSALMTRLAQAQTAFATQWSEIMAKSVQALGTKLTPAVQSGKMPASPREIYDLWVEAAEGIYAQSAHAGDFVKAQTELSNVLSQLRIAQRECIEEWTRTFDLPTRAEMNALHLQIKQLKESLQKLSSAR
jgi:class III poly(R)-hydroxyalkanoic acid synthase PhaE subunit